MKSFTDAPELLQALQQELEAAAARGRAVFIQVEPGSGAPAVVVEFVRQARRANRRLRTVIASAADPRLSAWHHIALRLTARHRTALALRQSAQEWIGVLPLIGPLLGAIASTAAELRHRPRAATAALGTGSAVDDVRRVLAHGRSDLRVIVLTDCEAADAAELSGAFAFMQQLAATRTLLILTCAADGADQARGFADLLWEAERLGVGRRLGQRQITVSTREAAILRLAAGLGRRFEMAQLMHHLSGSEAELEHELAALVRSNILAIHATIERNGELIDVYEFRDPSGPDYWRNLSPRDAASVDVAGS